MDFGLVGSFLVIFIVLILFYISWIYHHPLNTHRTRGETQRERKKGEIKGHFGSIWKRHRVYKCLVSSPKGKK
jgi:hypothetical protein